MSRAFTVLLSSAGRRVALLRCFREALDALGLTGRVLAADLSSLSPAFHDADEGMLVPRVADPDYVDRLLEICREHHVDLVVPLIDPELAILAVARPRFLAQGTDVHISDPAVTAIGGDKIGFHAWLVEQGFPTVRQGTPHQVLADPEGWQWPVLTKPSRGSCSIGVGLATDPADLARIAALPAAGEWLVQSVAPGVEYTVTVYVDKHGRARAAVPRLRVATRAGEVSKGVARRVEPVMKLACRVAEALPGARGTLNIQIFHDAATGELSIIELNARFGGGYVLAWQAGMRSAQWTIEEQLGLPSTISDQWEDGVVMLRFFDAVFRRTEDVGL